MVIDTDHPATITDSTNPLDGITTVDFNNGVLSNQTTGTKTTTSAAVWTLSGAGEYNVEAEQTLNLTGSLSGSGALTKTGAGVLTFNLTDTYDTRTGTTTISGGTLNVMVKDTKYNYQNLSASGQLIFDGGTLKFSSSGVFGLSHDIAVTPGNAVKLDIGASYVVPKGTPLANKSFDIIVSNSNNIFQNSLAFNGQVTNMTGYSGVITAENYGRITVEKANVLTATTTLQANSLGKMEVWCNQTIDRFILNGGTLSSKSNSKINPVLTANSGFEVSSDSTIDTTYGNNSQYQNLTLTGVLSGTGAINKTGTQSLKLTSDSSASYTGTITVSEGTLDLTGKVGGNVVVSDNGALRIDPANNNNFSSHIAGTVSGSGKLIITNSLRVGAYGANPIADLTGFSAIEIVKNRLHVTKIQSALGTPENPVAITVDSGGQYWGQSTDPTNLHIASVTVSGVGIEDLGVIRENLYNTPVTLAADSKLIQANITGSVNLQGYTLSVGDKIRNTWAYPSVTLAGDVIGNEDSAINVTCTSAGAALPTATTLSLSGNSKLQVPLLSIDNGDNAATVNLSKTQDSSVETLRGNGTLNISNGKLSVTQASDFTGAIDISSNGTLVLNGNLGATNSLNVRSGSTLDLGVTNAIATSGSVTNNATITASSDQTLNNLSGTTGTIILTDNANLTLNNNAATTYGGTINTGGTVTKTGAGTLTLSAVNTYTGETHINAGTVTITASSGNTGTFAKGTTVTVDGETSVLQGNGDVLGYGTGSVGTLNLYNGGKLVNNSTDKHITVGTEINMKSGQIYADPTATGNGTYGNFVFDNSINALSGTDNKITGNNIAFRHYQSSVTGGTIDVANDAVLTIDAIIKSVNATMGLLKTGAGELVLTRQNTYTGETHINAGTVTITASSGNTGTFAKGTTVTVDGETSVLQGNGDVLGYGTGSVGTLNCITAENWSIIPRVSILPWALKLI